MEKVNRDFYPQLDSLRAIAVLLVIISHWFSKDHFLNRYSANGVWGVTLFFVLSGFLISRILIKSKTKIEAGYPIAEAFKLFYIRRSLRIFPIYYFLLFVLFVFDFESVRDSFWWHFSYGSNIYFWLKGDWEGLLSHLWSLAVEEQFYLIMPALILFVSRRYLISVLIVGVLIGVIFRLFIVTSDSSMGRLLMPASLDSFCIGGLLACVRSDNKLWYKYYVSKQQWFLILSFFLLAIDKLPVFQILSAGQSSAFYILSISISFGLLINRVTYNIETPILKQILNNKVLLYVGKISYGIYLFHNFIPYFYGIEMHGLPLELSIYVIQFLRLVILISLASLSWFFIEKPLLSIKKNYTFV